MFERRSSKYKVDIIGPHSLYKIAIHPNPYDNFDIPSAQ